MTNQFSSLYGGKRPRIGNTILKEKNKLGRWMLLDFKTYYKPAVSKWRRKWQPTPVFFAWRIPWTQEPGGLESMRPKESDTTERLNPHPMWWPATNSGVWDCMCDSLPVLFWCLLQETIPEK